MLVLHPLVHHHLLLLLLLLFLKGCYLLEAGNFKVKEHFPFTAVQGVTVSSLTDGLVIIHIRSDGPDERVREGKIV